MILHIDMDAFFASIEQAVNPRLKGKPLIVGSRDSKFHTVVCAASYEAKACGIDSGMPSQEALKLCPDLEFVAANQGKYIWTSEQIFKMLRGYGFELIYASIDEFQMDVSGEPNLAALAKDIQEKITANFRITASIGIAKNCILAKLASKINKPRGIFIFDQANIPKELSQIPVEKLCGVGQKLNLIFYNLGIKTCLDLYQQSAERLKQILGKNGLNIYIALHSTDHFDLSKESTKPKSISHSYTLPMASENPGFIKAWIRLLSEMVSERLRKQNLSAKTIHLWLNGPEIGSFSSQKTFQQGINDGYEIYLRCLKIMARLGKRMPKIRALGVSGSSFLISERLFLFQEQKRREDLLRSIDQLNSRHGDATIFPAQVIYTRKMPLK